MSVINQTGTPCDECGVRPDCPMVVSAPARRVLCFGCIADLRLAGKKVRVRYAVPQERRL